MRICVAVKSVPDTAARIRIAAGGHAIETEGVKSVMSPYDEMALEQGLRMKEAAPDGEVVALSVGGGAAEAVLRSALALGADRGIHLHVEGAPGLGLDGLQTATIMAEALRPRPFDVLLFGRLAVDDQSAQVGSHVARLLGIPSVAEVIKIEQEDQTLRFHRLHHGRVEVIECPMPAAATAQMGLAEPRYPTMKSILAAKHKPIEEIPVEAPEAALVIVGLESPPPRRRGRIVGEGSDAVAELVRLLQEAQVL
jgi:electron transfer flavoprotein beta subunit